MTGNLKESNGLLGVGEQGRERCFFYEPTACNFRLTCRQQVSPKRYCLSTEVSVMALSVTYLTLPQVESSVSLLTSSG